MLFKVVFAAIYTFKWNCRRIRDKEYFGKERLEYKVKFQKQKLANDDVVVLLESSDEDNDELGA